MKKSLVLLALVCLVTSTLSAQNPRKPISSNIDHLLKSKANFEKATIFKDNARTIKGNFSLEKEVVKGQLLTLDFKKIHTLLDANPTNINLTIPEGSSKNKEMELVLYQSDILSEGFMVRGSKSKTVVYSSSGMHYHGIIKGDPNSLVAISIFKDEIHGVISDESGNRVIGKLQGNNDDKTHILYHEKDMLLQNENLCAGLLPVKNADRIGADTSEKTVGDCVKIYFEADYDIYLSKGSTTAGVSNYVTGFFNEVAVLYANESLDIGLSEIFIHETPSNYSGPGAGDYLNQFSAFTPSFNGSLGHYINLESLGGVAYLDVLCSNSSVRRGYSGIGTSYASVPTYSWTVMVVSHELGHNFGSNHTQACVWNGNNTAIDGCVAAEGNCANGPTPTNGGTIMSYCHTTSSGINFSLGFGPQPGDVMRARVASANCLPANCSNVPNCNDNILNGNETGVDCGGTCPVCPNCTDGILNNGEITIDCGGPNCAACPCNDIQMSLTINFDEYPEETGWIIVNAAGATVATLNYTSAQADNSTLIESICLPSGCYDFIITDTFGDGICCSYGSGSYSLADNTGTVVASGGNFDSSETTNFCLIPPPANPCVVNHFLVGNEAGTKLYQASDFVSSTALINTLGGAPSDIIYEAGNFIELKADFEVLPNNAFLAHIVPCSSSMPSGDPSTILVEINQNDNGLATFNFSVPNEELIEIAILDKNGNVLSKIIDNQKVPVGSQLISIDKRKFEPGLLFMQISSSTETKIVKWIN